LTGGRQANGKTQQHTDDYDGIIARDLAIGDAIAGFTGTIKQFWRTPIAGSRPPQSNSSIRPHHGQKRL
jgi:hypothetical protein